MEIKQTVTISGGYLEKRAVTLTDVLHEENRMYIHLSMGHPQIPTMLGLPQRVEKQRVMSKTDVIE